MNNFIESIITSIQNNIAFALIVFSVLVIIYELSLASIFKKIGHKTFVAFIPVYNIMTLLSILKIPQWMVLIMFIPFVNIIGLTFMTILIGYKLGTFCRKNILIKLGLMLLPFVFYPLLAFIEIDISDSKLDNNVQFKEKEEFVLESVDFISDIEAPQAFNLSDKANLERISIKKIKPKIEIKEPMTVSKATIAEHLSKANKDMPTAQDLTFDYNLIYNSREEKEEKVEEIVEVPPMPEQTLPAEFKIEETVEETSDISTIPMLHEVTLEHALPVDVDDAVPMPINKRYESQMSANIKQHQKQMEIAKQKEEESKEVVEPVHIIDNGVVNIDSSLTGLMASAPDFSILQKNKSQVLEMDKVNASKEEVKENIPTTTIQEVVSMNIVEPSQLPVSAITVEEKKEDVSVSDDSPKLSLDELLIPIEMPTTRRVLVDKACPQCHAKMKRDCPVCIMCGYRF